MEPRPDQVKGSAQCVQRIAMPVPLPSTRVILTCNNVATFLWTKTYGSPPSPNPVVVRSVAGS